LVVLLTGYPFLYLIVGSLTEIPHYRLAGVSWSPQHWTINAYSALLRSGSPIYEGLKVSALITVVGATLSLLSTAALGYGLSKSDLPGRRLLITLILVTMLFKRGMVPLYLAVRGIGLTDTLWSLILPFMVNAWYLFLVVKFLQTLPREIEDAARLDGCTEVKIFVRIIIPLSKPALATVGLFYALDYWNEWFWAILFLENDRLYPLQLVLRGLLGGRSSSVTRMAAIVLSSVPIVVLALCLQRYFMQGILYTPQTQGLASGISRSIRSRKP
jgi:putative aldouronate transport system permease protein